MKIVEYSIKKCLSYFAVDPEATESAKAIKGYVSIEKSV